MVILEFIRFILFECISNLIRNSPVSKFEEKSLILIRLDAIGDYILFRNFIKTLKENEAYKDYKVTLCGNIQWKEIAETFDRAYIDHYIWIDRIRFGRNLIYRYRKLKEITSKGYEIAIQPVYSREFIFGDSIIKRVHAKDKVGSIGDLKNIARWQKRLSDKYYNKLISTTKGIIFEFYRNKEFFEKFLDTRIELDKPSLDLSAVSSSRAFPENSFILFIGANETCRKWSPKHFAEVAKFISENYGLKGVICGTVSDRKGAKKIKKLLAEVEAYDYTGRTTLVELAFIISRAKLLVSNETLAPHIAVAVGTPAVVVSNGNHFGRFTPYPTEMSVKYYPVYHPHIENNLDKYQELSERYEYGSKLNINDIRPLKVIETILSI